jgi:hypothetical protein
MTAGIATERMNGETTALTPARRDLLIRCRAAGYRLAEEALFMRFFAVFARLPRRRCAGGVAAAGPFGTASIARAHG